MNFGAVWKNKDSDGFTGHFTPDVGCVLVAGCPYSIYLNKVDKDGSSKMPDYRIELKFNSNK